MQGGSSRWGGRKGQQGPGFQGRQGICTGKAEKEGGHAGEAAGELNNPQLSKGERRQRVEKRLTEHRRLSLMRLISPEVGVDTVMHSVFGLAGGADTMGGYTGVIRGLPYRSDGGVALAWHDVRDVTVKGPLGVTVSKDRASGGRRVTERLKTENFEVGDVITQFGEWTVKNKSVEQIRQDMMGVDNYRVLVRKQAWKEVRLDNEDAAFVGAVAGTLGVSTERFFGAAYTPCRTSRRRAGNAARRGTTYAGKIVKPWANVAADRVDAIREPERPRPLYRGMPTRSEIIGETELDCGGLREAAGDAYRRWAARSAAARCDMGGFAASEKFDGFRPDGTRTGTCSGWAHQRGGGGLSHHRQRGGNGSRGWGTTSTANSGRGGGGSTRQGGSCRQRTGGG